MKLKIYQVDAFTDKVFGGNPAAICPLDKWLSDELMKKIAMENNQAETAFYVKENDQYHIRWFTPTNVEIDLCGHATLGSAFVLFNHENYNGDVINFYSLKSGKLPVTKQGDYITLNFPADTYEKVDNFNVLTSGFDGRPVEVLKGKTKYVLVYEKESQVKNMKPDFLQVAKLDAYGVVITAQGDQVDFVSRFFAPRIGVNEDAVTGSSHTTLTPYWSKKLGKTELTAIQLSDRRGYLKCKYLTDRVEISGQAKLYLKGEIIIE